MTPIEVLKMLKSKIDEAEFHKSNYVLQTNDVEAINQALLLYDVIGSLVSPNSIQKEAEKYQQATANKMAIERTAFAQGALWIRSLFLPNDS